MRQTIVPAQITTVEDKIVANLNITQIALLAASLFIGVFIFAVMPEKLHFTLYKFPLMGISTLLCFILALRFRGRVVLSWILLLTGYCLRPGFYIYDKNDAYLRDIVYFPELKKKKTIKEKPVPKKASSDVIPITDFAKLEQVLIAHRGKLSLKFNKDGGMDVTW